VQPEDFDFFARLLKERSGLVLTKDKGYLVENRLQPLVRQRRLRSITELIGGLRSGDDTLVESAVDAMMAKDTGFFRDWNPFQHFRNVVLPSIRVARKAKRAFRVLCAGASTGQEAYSIAMILHEAEADLRGWQVEVLGIDLSQAAITTAMSAVYSQFDVQRGLPIRTLLKNFQKEDDNWRLSEVIRTRVSFKAWNLLDDLFPLGRFDVVLCRNVLSYFDMPTKFATLQKLSRVMADDAVLYAGVEEPLAGVSSNFQAMDDNLGIHIVQRPDLGKIKSLAAAG